MSSWHHGRVLDARQQSLERYVQGGRWSVLSGDRTEYDARYGRSPAVLRPATLRSERSPGHVRVSTVSPSTRAARSV